MMDKNTDFTPLTDTIVLLQERLAEAEAALKEYQARTIERESVEHDSRVKAEEESAALKEQLKIAAEALDMAHCALQDTQIIHNQIEHGPFRGACNCSAMQYVNKQLAALDTIRVVFP